MVLGEIYDKQASKHCIYFEHFNVTFFLKFPSECLGLLACMYTLILETRKFREIASRDFKMTYLLLCRKK